MQTTLGQLTYRFSGGEPNQDPRDAYVEALTELYDELCDKGFFEYQAIMHNGMMIAEVVGLLNKNATIAEMEATEIEILSALISA